MNSEKSKEKNQNINLKRFVSTSSIRLAPSSLRTSMAPVGSQDGGVVPFEKCLPWMDFLPSNLGSDSPPKPNRHVIIQVFPLLPSVFGLSLWDLLRKLWFTVFIYFILKNLITSQIVLSHVLCWMPNQPTRRYLKSKS